MVVGAECAWCDPVLICRHILGSMTHWNFSLMPLVHSAVEHTSIGPGSGACDYTVPAFLKVAAACTAGVWDHLIRFHCDTQTMVPHMAWTELWTDNATIVWNAQEIIAFGVHCTIVDIFANWSTVLC